MSRCWCLIDRRIDENILVNQVLDITKIQDEMNPKIKKSKKEPVVANVSETNLGIDTQLEHSQAAEAHNSTFDTPSATPSTQPISIARMVQVAITTTRNNTRLTLLIEHIPNMIKRDIDKDLALVHVKIQDSEHRISELEGIGAREALAMLKADMSKEERIETDEEELEDNHVTKELDEE
ncbi:hypothetical protein HAX54_002873 [Datura stramonium]|uniref:Uncharacterized protein n=1 Tax=Datura stramonium TaxID=4076 RepID=A0ABS8WRM9_DATST|nr:hypothetical protein [Datura stramonium]